MVSSSCLYSLCPVWSTGPGSPPPGAETSATKRTREAKSDQITHPHQLRLSRPVLVRVLAVGRSNEGAELNSSFDRERIDRPGIVVVVRILMVCLLLIVFHLQSGRFTFSFVSGRHS